MFLLRLVALRQFCPAAAAAAVAGQLGGYKTTDYAIITVDDNLILPPDIIVYVQLVLAV